ncbi:MAG: ABC transporter permease [Candidatus Accumulibacter sp.]|jgi:phospholipid/cholesterol/gamma-HCH transport system permease protein|nr:ABC transporter permease [Accumulibacter sp.]
MPDIEIKSEEKGGRLSVALSGDWTLSKLLSSDAVAKKLSTLHAQNAAWNLEAVLRLDSAGADLLWRAWGRRWPDSLTISEAHREAIKRIEAVPIDDTAAPPREPFPIVVLLGHAMLTAYRNLVEIVALVGQLVLDVAYLFAHPKEIPFREFSASIYKSGVMALPVTALVGFLIGIVLSFLSALQLKNFGADTYIVNLLGISVIRELGPVIVAVLVAGRSGSAMTAQIGAMRVTEEIDALAIMGVSRSLRLVLPKVLALSVTMPLLVLWCSSAGIFGGMVSANLEMGLSYHYFIESLPRAVPFANVWIGLGKGFFFGALIALVSCHFGLKIRPNTESLSTNTTTAVVTAITTVILVDALFAILTRGVGMPGGV